MKERWRVTTIWAPNYSGDAVQVLTQTDEITRTCTSAHKWTELISILPLLSCIPPRQRYPWQTELRAAETERVCGRKPAWTEEGLLIMQPFHETTLGLTQGTECHCDYTLPCINASLVAWENIACTSRCLERPPIPPSLPHQPSARCCHNLTFPIPLTPPPNLSQSILHEITRWHGRRCPGNHCYTTVAWSPSANKPRAQQGFSVAEGRRRYERRGNKRLEGGSGVEGQTLTAAALSCFHLTMPLKVVSHPALTLYVRQILQIHYLRYREILKRK